MAFEVIGALLGAGIFSVAIIAILILLQAFFLWLMASKVLKPEIKNFSTAIKVAFTATIAGLLLGMIPHLGWLIFIFVYIYLIKYFFKASWFQAFISWLATVALTGLLTVGIAIALLGGLIASMFPT